MAVLARALARLLGLLLLAVLALAGLTVAVFSIQGGHGTLSLPGLAAGLHLTAVRTTVASSLHSLEDHGAIRVDVALWGAGALTLGVVILTGSLVAPRERLILIARNKNGTISARRRALSQAGVALAEEPRSVLGAKARARPWRRSPGGLLRLRVEHPAHTTDREAKRIVVAALEPLTDSLPIRARVSARAARGARRAK